MTFRAGLRLLLLAALLVAPLGRIGMAEAMTGHCGTMAAAAHHGGDKRQAPAKQERMAVDCLTACAAIATLPAPVAAPPLRARALQPGALPRTAQSGLHPDAELPPPRLS